jgi:hypothetical protein
VTDIKPLNQTPLRRKVMEAVAGGEITTLTVVTRLGPISRRTADFLRANGYVQGPGPYETRWKLTDEGAKTLSTWRTGGENGDK